MIVVAKAARMKCFVQTTETTVSDSSNYHTVAITRGGQSETGMTLDSRNAEFTAYQEQAAGEIDVGQGDVIAVSCTVTGSPTPLLSSANFLVRCVFTARED